MTHPRVALFGTGWGTAVTLPALRAEGWGVPVLWSRTAARAEAKAAKKGIPEHTSDYEAALNRDDVDAAIIVVPTPSHRDMYLAAFAAGKPTIVEKPLAMNLDEAREIHVAARSAGVTAMVNFEFRFTPARLHVQRLLAEGYIGDLRHANIELYSTGYWGDGSPLVWRDRAVQGGGILNELGSHYIDLCRQWFGEITDVSARTGLFSRDRVDPDSGEPVQADAEDFLSASFALANGGFVTLTQTSAAAARQGMRANIVGSAGTLSLAQSETFPLDAPVYGMRAGDSEFRKIPFPDDLPPLDPDADWRVGATRLILREFERGIRDGVSPAPNIDDALRSQAVIETVRRAARSGTTAVVPAL